MNLQNVEDAERRNIAEKNVNHGHGVKVIDSGVVLVKEEMKPVREHLQLLGLNPKAERMVSTQRLVVEGVDKVKVDGLVGDGEGGRAVVVVHVVEVPVLAV